MGMKKQHNTKTKRERERESQKPTLEYAIEALAAAGEPLHVSLLAKRMMDLGWVGLSRYGTSAKMNHAVYTTLFGACQRFGASCPVRFAGEGMYVSRDAVKLKGYVTQEIPPKKGGVKGYDTSSRQPSVDTAEGDIEVVHEEGEKHYGIKTVLRPGRRILYVPMFYSLLDGWQPLTDGLKETFDHDVPAALRKWIKGTFDSSQEIIHKYDTTDDEEATT